MLSVLLMVQIGTVMASMGRSAFTFRNGAAHKLF
jgi:hypothetical protein